MTRVKLVQLIETQKKNIRECREKSEDFTAHKKELTRWAVELAKMDSFEVPNPAKGYPLPRKGVSPFSWDDYVDSEGSDKADVDPNHIT